MTKKERKQAMWTEVGRLTEEIPFMWSDFAIQIANHNINTPQNKITDSLLIEIVEQGKKMDVNSDEATHLTTNNSKTNLNSLKALMGEKLFKKAIEKGINWGYIALMYNSIYEKKFFG